MAASFYRLVGILLLIVGILSSIIAMLALVGEGILGLGMAIIASVVIFIYFLFGAMSFLALGDALKFLKRTSDSNEKILEELRVNRNSKVQETSTYQPEETDKAVPNAPAQKRSGYYNRK
ncbi:hypothetical protein ACQCU1_01840 [Sutcliffiella horikoshii]|uniref:hypothetical protein n=1 Tax=Sutcliffiella horikoshii TaxID=79883 RepID=UPI003CF35073